MSLLVVIAVVFMLASIMRRFNVAQAGQGQMKVVASMTMGTKERVVVLQVGDEQHLIGVTGQNINHLSKLDTPLTSPSQQTEPHPFKDKLTQALAGKIQSSLQTKKEGTS
ncbi:flagellar biosynthetic protein FliO [Aestuariibacter sp. AA17]|uniref:Flagellar protein n=1 Tax=Fluctibacter corallii TaxID=2984329 RepID=A0ABT3A9R5_9ALTE|nr:flagellar biosynthetic protein FliO [Aestuariibacter sp. AA17]MCV2885413.1 flagellar biosynthetic protein FliO [Aestuariibacter sp. AA17]